MMIDGQTACLYALKDFILQGAKTNQQRSGQKGSRSLDPT
jgi:hypothetical protein